MRPILYPYQKRWLADNSRFKIGMFARQTGKTFTTTLEIALDAARAEMDGRATRWVILSRSEKQAAEAMRQGVKTHLRAICQGAKSLGFDLAARMRERVMEVEFSHGSMITALSSNPNTARGFSANVFLDEFAFHQDSRKIWSALFPVISRGTQKLRVVSTPNGMKNMFYDLMENARYASWSRHKVDIYQAVADGLPYDINELRSHFGDPDGWAQEFELQWLDEASAWLPYDLISACEDDEECRPAKYAGGPAYAGCDIGRTRDLFVIWVVEKCGDLAITREIIARRGISFAEQDRLLDGVMGAYNVRRLCMDQSGMGEKPVEDAIRRYGKSRVEGVKFTLDSKLALASLGKSFFEDRKIRIPADDRALREDLHKLRRESTPTGNPRFVADSDSAGHADRAWACFMALMAMDKPPAAYAYQPARPDQPGPYDDFFDDCDKRGFGRGAW